MSKNLRSFTTPQCAWLCLLCLLVLANVGCQRRDEEIAGVSIPIPEKMTKNPDKSFVPIKGFEDGQVSYQGKVPPGGNFYFLPGNDGGPRLAAQFVVRRPERSDRLYEG